jgi:hypothetical protein
MTSWACTSIVPDSVEVALIKAKRPCPVIEGGQAKQVDPNGSPFGAIVEKIAKEVVEPKLFRNTAVQQLE